MQTLKKTLEAIGCGVLALMTSFMVHWETPTIQLINSILILILLLIGFCKVVFKRKEPKSNIDKKKQKNLVEGFKNDNLMRVISKQLPIKVINLSNNPTQEGEQLGEIFIETMKGGKRFMNWIKLNKGAIISALVILLGLLESVFNFLYQYVPIELGFNVVGIALAFIGGLSAVFTSGFGSSKFKEAIAQIKDQLNGDETDLQHISSVKYIERQIMVYEKSVLTIEKDMESLKKRYAKAISEYNTCEQLGLPFDEETIKSYAEYKEGFAKLQGEYNSKNSALQTYKNKLALLQNSK